MNRRSVAETQSANLPVSLGAALLARLDAIINGIFALNHEAALVRRLMVQVSFLVLWILMAFTTLSTQQYKDMFASLLQAAASANSQKLLSAGFTVLTNTIFRMDVIRHLLAMLAPFWLMQHISGIYLADIFEKEEKVAYKFIRQASFAFDYQTIHISKGSIIKDDQASPILQFGGPGNVVVELDSAVVVESPDGSVRVIGPASLINPPKRGFMRTGAASKNASYVPVLDTDTREWLADNAKKDPAPQGWQGNAIIHGFERIRQCIDLRDVVQKQDVSTRSSDGIPVTASDIQYSYIIYRGARPLRTARTPFPYDEDAILNLVFGAIRLVKLGEPPDSGQDWLKTMPDKINGLIVAEISSFVSRRGLSDFLVAIGKPEDDNQEERKKESDLRIQDISGGEDEPPLPGGPAETATQPNRIGTVATSPVDFVPRTMLTKMVSDNFQNRAQQRGTQLNWLGIGTWSTPDKIIPKHHSEAWQISRENLARGNPIELERIQQEAMLREQIRLIQYSVLQRYISERDKHQPEKEVIISVLNEYLLLLESARELYRPNIPEEILNAIQEIENWLHPNSYRI
jgi:hypothetical protein